MQHFKFKFRPPIFAASLVTLLTVLWVVHYISGPIKIETAAKNSNPDVQQNPLDASVDFKKIDLLLADINSELQQPNILREDILRGWYLGGKTDKKYGTPETWVFEEAGKDSRWISPNAIEEVEIKMSGELCRQTAGSFKASCLDTADDQCEYIGVSSCECSKGTKWHEEQGCILENERGSFIAINSVELAQGYYTALPNEKKLNTPSDWIWTEDGPQSSWHAPRKIYFKP